MNLPILQCQSLNVAGEMDEKPKEAITQMPIPCLRREEIDECQTEEIIHTYLQYYLLKA